MKFAQIAGGVLFGLVLAVGLAGPMKLHAEEGGKASAGLAGKKVNLSCGAVAKQDGSIEAVDSIGFTFHYEVGGKQIALFVPWGTVTTIVLN